jgi:hypothetical protein
LPSDYRVRIEIVSRVWIDIAATGPNEQLSRCSQIACRIGIHVRLCDTSSVCRLEIILGPIVSRLHSFIVTNHTVTAIYGVRTLHLLDLQTTKEDRDGKGDHHT